MNRKILERLRVSEFWQKSTVESGDTIKNLICPDCGSKTAWAYKENPFSINCNRMNKCGARVKSLSLFPDLLKNIETDYPPTPEDPHAPAREFLSCRGIKKTLAGLDYQYWKNVRGTGSGAVMFPISESSWNGRLINPPKGEGKTHNKGSTKGLFWKHPGYEYDRGKETWVTEGIIDALSLIEMGQQAIAVLASGQDPAKIDLKDFPRLVFAFDNDAAGHKAFKKWTASFPGSRCMTPASGDWNDMLLTGENINDTPSLLEHNAALALCEDPQDWADEYKSFKGFPPGLFEFDGEYWYANKDNEVSLCGNFSLSVDHYRLDTRNPEAPEFKYQVKIIPSKGRSRVFAVSPREISSEGAMTTMCLSRANVLWSGTKAATMALVKKIVNSNVPVIRQLEVKGLDIDSGNYVFKNFMIDKTGRFHKLNGDGFYRYGGECLRPAQSADLFPAAGQNDLSKIFNLLTDSWGERAAMSLGWMCASWFIDEIKEKIKFFPLLSMHGDSQTGKSNLTRILNACQCLDEEGIPLKQANTEKGIIRRLAQRSNLFQALLEESKDRKSRFDYRFVLTAFNDAPLQVRAEKSMDNTTVETQLHASIMFVQNHEPFKSKPEKERVISLEFKEEQIDQYTTKAFEELSNISPAELAGFYPAIMQHHLQIKSSWFDFFQKAKDDLKESVKDARIREVHAVALAFYRIMCDYIGISAKEWDILSYVADIANKKILSCRDDEASIADIFLEAVGNAEGDSSNEFISKKENRFYIYMPGALAYCKGEGLTLPVESLLNELKSHRAYKGQKAHRFNNMNPKKAWLFDAAKLECVE